MSTQAAADSATLATPRHVPAAAGRLWWYGGQVAVQLTGDATDGRVGMWVWDAHRGAASPVHVHSREDEYFLVVDGRARLFVGDGRIDAGPGDLVVLPRGVPHAYLIVSETARLVGMASPGGFESFADASACGHDGLQEACRDVVHVPRYADASRDRTCGAESLDVGPHRGG